MAMAKSIFTIALELGNDRLAKMARLMGFDTVYKLGVGSQKRGIVPDKEWKRMHKGGGWMGGDTINAVIGQGFVLSTPLQLCVMMARVASGRVLKPYIVAQLGNENLSPPISPALDYDPQNLQFIRQGLFGAVNDMQGTANNIVLNNNPVLIAGKTGTSQVRNISLAERESGVIENEELPYFQRDHALFSAYAPHANPRYAISVIIEHGGKGSKLAAPIARDILLYALNLDSRRV